jgi:hypothetical protein
MGGSMSSVVISGDTSGAITLAAPSVAGTNTITLPASTGTVLTTGSPQSNGVIQVVQSSTTTQTTSSSTSYADATGFTATITPKFATSKVLIMVGANGCFKNSGNTGSALNLKLQKNGSDLIAWTSLVGTTGSSVQNYVGSNVLNYLDSPATTSATTYKVQLANNVAASFVAINQNNDTSTITLLEIAQ